MRFRIPKILKNKYLLVFVAMLAWLLFFDSNNLFYQCKLNKQIRELERERDYYIEETTLDSIAIKELKENPEAIEKYAREEYLMKKEGEYIYLIEKNE